MSVVLGYFRQQAPHFPGVHFDPFCHPKLCDYTSLDKRSAYTRKITSIILSPSLLADQLLRKAPLTASLPGKKTTRQVLTKLCHTLTDANKAIISSSWMTVLCPLDIMSESVFLSTSVLKKDNCYPDILTIKPPSPLYTSWHRRTHPHKCGGPQLARLRPSSGRSVSRLLVLPVADG